jgi:predicted transcriptional regulator
MKKSRANYLKSQPKVFRNLSGITVEKYNILLKQLQPKYIKSETERFNKKNRERNIGGGRKKELDLEDQLLMTLIYYRHYISQSFLGLIFNLHNSNVCRHIKYISPLLAKIFKIPSRKIESSLTKEEIELYFIDATEQPINRPEKKQKEYYSGKKKRHTLKNQIVIDNDKKICSVTRSVKGKKHDKKLFDESRVYAKENSNIKGDLGYLGSNRITIPKKKPKNKELTKEEKKLNKEFSKERIKIEHVFGKMKNFQILAQRFRNPRETHALIFKNIAGLYNLSYT